MASAPRLLVAGDDLFRAAVVAVLPSDCLVTQVATAGDAAAALLATRPDLALLDFRTPALALPGGPVAFPPGPSPEGLAVCRRIKGAAATLLLPVIALTDPGSEAMMDALDAGADQALAFPPHPGELRARLRSALRTRAATSRLEDATQVIFALANAVEAKDAYTEGHTERVGAIAVEVGRLAGLDEETQESLRQGGVLHDIGKIGIPNEIINKAGLLTTKERIVMNKHPIIGERICEPLKSLRHLLPIIRWHHEKLDGSGYPDGLKGSAFPLPAQVLQLSDIYDAITTDRPYHRARTRASAIGFLMMEAGKGWRDPQLVALVERAANALNMGRTRDEDIPPPPAPIGQWRTE